MELNNLPAKGLTSNWPKQEVKIKNKKKILFRSKYECVWKWPEPTGLESGVWLHLPKTLLTWKIDNLCSEGTTPQSHPSVHRHGGRSLWASDISGEVSFSGCEFTSDCSKRFCIKLHFLTPSRTTSHTTFRFSSLCEAPENQVGNEHVCALFFGKNSRSQIAKEEQAKSAALKTSALWATHSSPGQVSCSSTPVFVFALQTDLVVGAFHHTAGAQNLRLGSCCLFVLQVLLSNLEKKKKNMKRKSIKSTTLHAVPWVPHKEERGETVVTLFLISRTSFGLVFIGMNWLATAAWRAPSSFDHCEHAMRC